jgi:hypothetical protein
MNFTLDPSSGLADSYLDIEFSITVPEHRKTIIHIHNEVSGDQLQILGTSFGYILEGDKLVLKNRTNVTGHINIFNHDKMNKKFMAYRSVTLKCVAEFYNSEDEKIGEEEESVIFYNEMHSLDADIIPFDLIIHNRSINITDNEALRMDIISDIPKKYELCISSLDDRLQCHIEITADEGKTSIEIPAEFLYHDLELKKSNNKKFKFHYIKRQGTTLSRIANKRYMPISGSEISFQITDELSPLPQQRTDPSGRLMSQKFIVSDRYLVMCPREYSGFAPRSEFGKSKLMDLTMMVNEGQYINSLSKQIKQFDNGDSEKIRETTKSIHLANQAKNNIARPQISMSQVHIMKNVSRVYDTISLKNTTQPQLKPQSQPSQRSVQTFSANRAIQSSPEGGCTPCSRKKQQNAQSS